MSENMTWDETRILHFQKIFHIMEKPYT